MAADLENSEKPPRLDGETLNLSLVLLRVILAHLKFLAVW